MKYLISVFFLLFAATSFSQSRFGNASSWDEIFSKAKSQNKMVIIDCYFEGCHPCKQMDDEVFPHPAVRQLMNDNFIGIKTDCLKEDLGKALQMKFSVTGFPTYLIFTCDGALIDYFSGYKEADKFVKLLNNAMDKNQEGITLTGFAPDLDVDYPPIYTAFFKERKPINGQELETLFDQQADKYSEKIIMPLLVSRNLPENLADFVLNNCQMLQSKYGVGLVNEQRLRIIRKRIEKAPRQVDEQWLTAFMAQMKSLSRAKDWPTLQLDIAELYYYNYLKDPAAFFKYAAAHPNNDDNKIRYMGMYLNQPDGDVDQRSLYLTWASKVLNSGSSEEALTMAAEIFLKQGEKQDAARLADWAIQKAKNNNRDASGPQSILDKINN